MSDFISGFLYCAGAAVTLAALIFFGRRYSRSPRVDDLDYDNGTPDCWVEEDKW
ncbi:hypothetical protein TAL182_CH03033 [Rhizobium sp. TAL182]|uniref:hypothetical protein n=1 Tax=Rhizobium sp. TAL182 TaxID=2020313 RepID=UPI000A211646|nr:hypothetical protein [Rhizobium sp. TAL182]ARO24778.1 hypothetical protein TAL182_CH03033 [Rhizobium sp. TAL182]